jgi:hypothetical protein
MLSIGRKSAVHEAKSFKAHILFFNYYIPVYTRDNAAIWRKMNGNIPGILWLDIPVPVTVRAVGVGGSSIAKDPLVLLKPAVKFAIRGQAIDELQLGTAIVSLCGSTVVDEIAGNAMSLLGKGPVIVRSIVAVPMKSLI